MGGKALCDMRGNPDRLGSIREAAGNLPSCSDDRQQVRNQYLFLIRRRNACFAGMTLRHLDDIKFSR